MNKARALRVLSVLDIISEADGPVRISELETVTGLPKATVHRICTMLIRNGFIRRETGSPGHVIGPKLQSLANNVMANKVQSSHRHAVLKSLSEALGETCNIAVPDGSELIYVDRIDTQWALRVQMPVGTRVPLYCTASGKLFLSSLSKQRRQKLLERIKLEPLTKNTLTSVFELNREIETIRATGYSTDNEEFVTGMVAVAVPIVNKVGKLYATLSLHAPIVRMSLDDALKHIPLLRNAASEISDDVVDQNFSSEIECKCTAA